MTSSTLKIKPTESLLLFMVILAVCALCGALLASLFISGGIDTKSLRVATVIQDCVMFILPATITAVMVSSLPARFLGVDVRFSKRLLLLAVLALIVSIPAMNWVVMLNNSIILPESLSGLEQWMKTHEESAAESIKILLGTDSAGSLIINLLIVGILAGLSEELLFRGTLQKIICSSRINRHLGIWIAAAIFSAIHMQFFGFFPRLILGAFFGYLFYWSGSIWLPVIIHAMNNSMVVLSYWRSQTMGEGSLADSPLNQWGVQSPLLISMSIVLTGILIMMAKKCGEKHMVDKSAC